MLNHKLWSEWITHTVLICTRLCDTFEVVRFCIHTTHAATKHSLNIFRPSSIGTRIHQSTKMSFWNPGSLRDLVRFDEIWWWKFITWFYAIWIWIFFLNLIYIVSLYFCKHNFCTISFGFFLLSKNRVVNKNLFG